MKMLFASAVCLLVALPAAGQSNIQNGRLQERAAGDLARTFQQLSVEAGPVWVAYSVPTHPDWDSCCWDNRATARNGCGGCSLEERKDVTIRSTDSAKRPVELEGSTSAVILYRIEQARLSKVRAFSESCRLDAGGRSVYWLTGVKPAESIALLKSLVQAGNKAAGADTKPHRLISDQMVAIAAHQAPEAVTTLIDLARRDPDSRVRGDALFWLAQRAGEKAAGTITDAILDDPDTKVKERAVFALSQLPRDEGVAKLIEVARTNRNARVRQQAVFWLGQSRDPRALAFFEEILLK